MDAQFNPRATPCANTRVNPSASAAAPETLASQISGSRPAALASPEHRAPTPLHRVSSKDLLSGAREMEIEHGGSLYRLRLTALGKLILTK